MSAEAPPPEPPDPAPPEEAPEPAPICGVCGAGLEPDQTYCLECGSPTPLAPRPSRASRTGVLVAALLIAVAVLVLVVRPWMLPEPQDGPAPAFAH